MPITDLPLEILVNILNQLRTHNTRWYSRYRDYDTSRTHSAQDTRGAHALGRVTRVNKSWYTLAQPLLYSNISLFSLHGAVGERRDRILLRTLKTKPRYYEFIRRLRLGYRSHEHIEVGLSVLERCTNLRSLSLEGDVKSNYRKLLIKLLVTMNLHELLIGEQLADLVLEHMITHGTSENLKTLIVVNDDMYSTPLVPHISSRSHVEELVVHTNFWPSDSIMTLVRWPKRLRVLRFDISPTSYLYSHPHGLLETAALQRLLDIHSDTLEHIELGVWWVKSGLPMVDLSNYTNLKGLEMHNDNVLRVPPDKMCSILPESLRYFGIDYEIKAQQERGWDPVLTDHIVWLDAFLSIRDEATPNHQLEQIHINYRFDDEAIECCPITGYIESTPWPGQVLQDAAKTLARFNVSITYPRPYLTEEEWSLMNATQTVPTWRYHTTIQDRLAIKPATPEQRAECCSRCRNR